MFIFFIIAFISCTGYEPLTLIREPFTSKDLRLDGYYYNLDKQYSNGVDNDFVKGFTLNQNGIYFEVLWGSIDPRIDPKDWVYFFDKRVKYRVDKSRKFLKSRSSWGVFSVNDFRIIIQRWQEASAGGAHPTRTIEGTILNDTTIHFHNLIGAHPNNKRSKKKIKAIDETYHFRQFSPKPDSTNVFIK